MITSALLLIGSCGAHDVTPPEGRADSAVASQPRRHVASGSGSVAVDRDNASGSSGVFATYETLTLVDITMTGTFQKKNDQNSTVRLSKFAERVSRTGSSHYSIFSRESISTRV